MRLSRARSLALMLALFGCARAGSEIGRPAVPLDSNEELDRLLRFQSGARARDRDDLTRFVRVLVHAQRSDEAKAEYGDVDWAALNEEAERMLDEWIASGEPRAVVRGMESKAELLLATGRANQAIAGYQALHERDPSFESALGLLWVHVEAEIPMADAPGFCAANRKLAGDDEQTFEFLLGCALLNPSDSAATSLPWASDADLELYTEGMKAIETLAAVISAGLRRHQERREADD